MMFGIGVQNVLEVPLALELEALSNIELNHKIADAFKTTKKTATTHSDNSYQQKLFQALSTEVSRRKMIAKTKADKIDSGLLDEDIFNE